MKTTSLQITFPDNTSNILNIFEYEEAKVPVVIIFSAMGVKASYYRHYAAEMVRNGLHIITIDQRGNDNSSVRPSRKVNFGYKEIVEIDYPHIVRKVKFLFPESQLYIMGHSLGGQLASLYACKHPEIINGLILNASCSVYYKGWSGFQKLGVYIGAAMCKLVANTKGYYPGKTFGFGGTEARQVINDWHYTAVTGKYKAGGSAFDYETALEKLRIPIMAISYEGDSASPKAALDNLCNKFGTSAKINRHHLIHQNHPSSKYNHYSWVRKPELTISLIRGWISEQS